MKTHDHEDPTRLDDPRYPRATGVSAAHWLQPSGKLALSCWSAMAGLHGARPTRCVNRIKSDGSRENDVGRSERVGRYAEG